MSNAPGAADGRRHPCLASEPPRGGAVPLGTLRPRRGAPPSCPPCRGAQLGSVEFNRVSNQQSSARTFDLTVHMKDTTQHQFVNLQRSVYKELYRFLTDKKIRIKNVKAEGFGDDDGDDDEGARRRRAARPCVPRRSRNAPPRRPPPRRPPPRRTPRVPRAPPVFRLPAIRRADGRQVWRTTRT